MPSKLQSYDWLLFDADETLFSFDAHAGLQQLFQGYGVEFTSEHYRDYQAVNKPLWQQYQDGEIDAATLQRRRFERWAAELEVDADELNSGFLDAMAMICQPLEGARELLKKVRQSAKIGIVTNGFTALQEARLAQTGLRDLVDLVVISEQVGTAKPDPNIFSHALDLMGQRDRERVLMTGDNPHSDVLGAQQSGLHSCWLNTHGVAYPLATPPHYTVRSLPELDELLTAPA
ncbi:pyrimidine 5'-nucleotidase [Pseudidiomarina terrestris]|uniref:Pyrimidine 5'-nucleotidase n=1 Tax=Pseudidiomarina terrestris TaxID=2820060 RepID=A0AAW7R0J1_9GAMM|nr:MULTISPECIES: pyrimidine 5'-nucleotidase [unclassified Pseudidiomarina]MDN7124779.1 pyrimidine 5'-nucleotidase [Pseudidiomarina sp. 1APP75-32.1]MDN7129747.1 pyrimidine 5'-nucleotidase [Pseudidiomarina sp. 1APR75-15]MDN7136469.1 pyrimidine 5'-nucleotidase [Pseudidiomarina sp. 1ASP75-5]MEA3588234.1 pyrimidine 5'-nucleotidase [Pseudidiomarina sp. 1APP75-27a]